MNIFASSVSLRNGNGEVGPGPVSRSPTEEGEEVNPVFPLTLRVSRVPRTQKLLVALVALGTLTTS